MATEPAYTAARDIVAHVTAQTDRNGDVTGSRTEIRDSYGDVVEIFDHHGRSIYSRRTA